MSSPIPHYAQAILTLHHPEGGMAAWASWPRVSEPAPALLIMEHALGIDLFTETMGRKLTEAGYATLIPDLYHRFNPFEAPLDKMKRLRDPEIIRDLAIARSHLFQDPQVDPARIGVIGFCMGGRMALRALEERALGLKAGVSYYGGHLRVAWGEDQKTPFDLIGQIEAPLLFHFGNEDTNPSPRDRADLEQELTRLHKTHVFHSYDGAGHAFMDFTRTERFRQNASESSWQRTLQFLRENL
ncbi:Dienelactone hydrolase domain protein [mine drainage metagenome]|uniref:Dienelactone hydrolase domain protein n=1 Tax=mine drainage metagenome TaxID=410659 RepID=T1AJ96_9ZZZZ